MSDGERHYAITHETRYRYAGVVGRSYGLFHQRPRDLPWQQVHEHEVDVDPVPGERATRVDLYGNLRTWFLIDRDHSELVVTARSRVAVGPQEHDPAALALPWEQARPAARPDVADAWRQVDLTLESPLVDVDEEVREYARPSFAPGRPVGEVVLDLTTRIHEDFEYRSGATTVTTRVHDVLRDRRGVCQDFAQLMLACLRSHGLAGRYVSGYLATVPPPGRPRLVGADASHAWVGCWVPGPPGTPGDPLTSWLYADPTNDRLCDQSHATVAWGRDYGDVAPLRGVIFSRGSGSRMTVSVDMAPLSVASSSR
ncbi:transglutaminase family protein [Auraticoccus monumenti]|uniref:Transglutaminase-like enzyme, putative cysteine protease n=1 Tax=Auraticoccus monumenti TaxID=675864 RepID=A0A1G6Z7D6_9ACTN|nr:transglutaminase family protein [Auraticoccus monumenti]SDD97887.1 Transglutaminase-like enzyme, putative cysteine protease [Auraticoccus monumenti]